MPTLIEVSFIEELSFEQWRIIVANCIGFLYLLARCAALSASDKRSFLILSNSASVLNVLMYGASGLWASCISVGSDIVRNAYNTTPRPRVAVNALIFAVSLGLAAWTLPSTGLDAVACIPLIIIAISTAAVSFARSYMLMIALLAAADVLWTIYDLRTLMLIGMVSDIAGFVMPAMKRYLAAVDGSRLSRSSSSRLSSR